AQHAAGSATKTEKKKEGGQDKIDSQVDLFDFIEPVARAKRRKEIQRASGDEQVQCKERRGNAVNERQLGPQSAAPLGKYQGEVHQHGGLQQERHYVRPINNPVKGIQLAAVMKTVEDERDQAKNVEMNRARRVPSAHKNEQADEQIKQSEDTQIVFNGGGILLRRGDQRRFEGAPVAQQLVADFGPGTHVEQHARDVHGAADGHTPDGFD